MDRGKRSWLFAHTYPDYRACTGLWWRYAGLFFCSKMTKLERSENRPLWKSSMAVHNSHPQRLPWQVQPAKNMGHDLSLSGIVIHGLKTEFAILGAIRFRIMKHGGWLIYAPFQFSPAFPNTFKLSSLPNPLLCDKPKTCLRFSVSMYLMRVKIEQNEDGESYF